MSTWKPPTWSIKKGTAAKPYRAVVRYRGREFTVCCRLEREARKWATDKVTELEATSSAGYDPSRGRTTLSAYLTGYMEHRQNEVKPSTFEVERYMFAKVPAWLAKKPLGALDKGDLTTAYRELTKAGASDATVRRFHEALRSALSGAVEDGFIPANPALGIGGRRRSAVRAKTAPIKPFIPDEVQTAYEAQAAITRYADLTLFAYHTGLRSGELRALLVGNITHDGDRWSVIVERSAPDSGHVILDETKTSKPRHVPLDNIACGIAEKWAMGKGDDELLFATSTGTLLRHRALLHHLHWHDEPDKHVTVKGYKVIRKGFKGTGQGHRFHDLRHGAAVRWLRAGIDIKTVQAWLGHASAAMTLDRYAHYIGQDADDAAIARLNALDGAITAGKTRANS